MMSGSVTFSNVNYLVKIRWYLQKKTQNIIMIEEQSYLYRCLDSLKTIFVDLKFICFAKILNFKKYI